MNTGQYHLSRFTGYEIS